LQAKTASPQECAAKSLAAVGHQKFHDEQDDEPQQNREADTRQHGQDIDDNSRAQGVDSGVGSVAQTVGRNAADLAREHRLDLTTRNVADD